MIVEQDDGLAGGIVSGDDPADLLQHQSPPADSLTYDAIAQYADLFDFELDDFARRHIAADFEARAVADRARAEQFARINRLVAGHEGDAVLVFPAHFARIAAAAFLPVHAHDHVQHIRVGDFVGGDDARADRIGIVEVLAFARPETRE